MTCSLGKSGSIENISATRHPGSAWRIGLVWTLRPLSQPPGKGNIESVCQQFHRDFILVCRHPEENKSTNEESSMLD